MAIGSLHQISERDQDHKTITWKRWWHQISEVICAFQAVAWGACYDEEKRKEKKKGERKDLCAGVYKTVYP